MKTTIFFLLSTLFHIYCLGQDAKSIIRKADEKFRGKSSKSSITMVITRANWSREVSMKSWTYGNNFTLIYITSPAKEKGQVFLKRESEIWNWLPSIERLIKIPPSMMLQSWMGSDFTNDDLVRESSLVEDYNHKLLDKEIIQNYTCYKIELTPKYDAPVVWGKIIMWVSQDDHLWLKGEYYDEDNFLVNTEILSEIKFMGNRKIPTKLEMIPADKKDQKTTLIFNNIEFNINIDEKFFSQQNMKRIR